VTGSHHIAGRAEDTTKIAHMQVFCNFCPQMNVFCSQMKQMKTNNFWDHFGTFWKNKLSSIVFNSYLALLERSASLYA
jgi:hypothetical protein